MTSQAEATRRAKATPINERYWLSVKLATDYLSIGRDTLDKYRDAGDITPVRLGTRDLRYKRCDLEELADRIERSETNYQKALS